MGGLRVSCTTTGRNQPAIIGVLDFILLLSNLGVFLCIVGTDVELQNRLLDSSVCDYQ